jgi:hypothetical protein
VIGPKPIASKHAEAATGRAIGVALGLIALVSVALIWLGAVLGLAVRVFQAAAGWG